MARSVYESDVSDIPSTEKPATVSYVVNSFLFTMLYLLSILIVLLSSRFVIAVTRNKDRLFVNNDLNPRHLIGAVQKDAIFDYVIVGGGTAGLVVAARLAQNLSNTVAVIEAGGFSEDDVGNLSAVPAYSVRYAGSSPSDTNPLIDWGFVTTPQIVSRVWTSYYPLAVY